MTTQTQARTSTPPPPAAELLAAELAAYQQELPRLLADGQEGRWVLIQGSEVAGIGDTFADAVQAGDERFGLTPFLVQRILAEKRPARITRT
ncbi:MAG: hypothetical protein JNM56_34695 [Planctomycetia bacterium]|nr:hypothetical protein [Planctomycetia bacterium]